MSDMTNVSGYFNGNSFPIQLNISSIGQTYTLAPGEFVTALNDKGEKVKLNDPVFEFYVGKMRLSKEVLKDRQVHICRVMSRDERGQVPSFQSAPIRTKGDGKLVTPTIPPASAHSGPNSPVQGMSVQDAIAAGLIPKPRITTDRVGVKDTDGTPMRGESLPEITYDDADVRNYRPKQQLDKSIIEDKAVLNVVRDTTPPAAVPMTVAPAQLPEVPTPTLEEAEEQLASKDTTIFECDLVDPPKKFTFRSQLEAYLRKNHPDKLESYMARYPKRKQLVPPAMA